MRFSQVMLDLETYDTLPTAAIASIGACKFSWSGEILDKFYVNVDPVNCKKYGLTISKETLQWWENQSKDIKQAITKDQQSLETALNMLSDWTNGANYEWWCNGMNFDFPILEYAHKKVGIKCPWKYYNLNDYRTILTLFGLRNDVLRQAEAETYHNALGDAIWQAKTLIKLIGEHKLNG